MKASSIARATAALAGAAAMVAVGGAATAGAQETDGDSGSLTVNGSGVHSDSLASPKFSSSTDPLDFSSWQLCDVEAFPYGGPTGTVGPFGACAEVVVRGGEMNIGGLNVPIPDGSLRVAGQEIPVLSPPANFPSGVTTFEGAPGTPHGYGVDHRDLPIPGGALGSADGFNLTSVSATVEALETPVLNALAGSIDMPIRVKLENPMLGNSCYLGSQQNPIVLNIRTSDHGAPGAMPDRFQGVPGGAILGSVGSDSDFAVPAAQGCGLWGSLNWLVNMRANAPSPAGQNSIITEYDAYHAPAPSVIAWRNSQG